MSVRARRERKRKGRKRGRWVKREEESEKVSERDGGDPLGAGSDKLYLEFRSKPLSFLKIA